MLIILVRKNGVAKLPDSSTDDFFLRTDLNIERTSNRNDAILDLTPVKGQGVW